LPVTLNFKGQEVFKTFIGGVLTFLYIFLLIWFGISYLIILLNKGNTSVNTNEVLREFLTESDSFQPGSEGFSVSIGGINLRGGPNYIIDPDYFTFEFLNIKILRYDINGYFL
jgi:hypothetical protein